MLDRLLSLIDYRAHLQKSDTEHADVRWFDVFQMARSAPQQISTNTANFAALRKQLKRAPMTASSVNEDLFDAPQSAIAA